MLRPRKNVISLSGGKDSVATFLVCRELEPIESIELWFAETDNEHPLTYSYLDYLEQRFNLPIRRLKADFAQRIERKLAYVAEHWRAEGIDEAIVQSALGALVPTGIAFLDLCIWKGRFPSRKAQFCTEELKTVPLQNAQCDLIDAGFAVWSWQGIRADESLERRYRPSFEQLDDFLFVNRPILRWTAADTFEAMACCNVKPNPLYTLGMKRVGCMPCINCGKDELSEIAKRWPEVIARIAQWEAAVKSASKRQGASFFPAPDDGRGELQGRNIADRVMWAKTSFGGKQFDILSELPAPACYSHYGLCE